MDRKEEKIGKGSEDKLYRYRLKRDRRRFVRRIVMPLSALVLLLLMTAMLLQFGFVVKKIEITGVSSYTIEEIRNECGIEVKDNMFSLSESVVERTLKQKFPYIKSVKLKKDFPSTVSLTITEEYTTFCYELEGEFFLFNHDFRLMDKFDSLEALTESRNSIYVKIPLPESSIVPQYIQFSDENTYVKDFISVLSASSLIESVDSVDLTDKFALSMVCYGEVHVELGDYTQMEDKLSALYRLIGEKEKKMSGSVDLSDYPRCFCDLNEE